VTEPAAAPRATTPAVTGIVLAAGAGVRFGRPKAGVVVDGRRLIDRAVDTLRRGGCTEVVAVVRSAAITVSGGRAVVNPDAGSGMGSSLRAGLAAVAGTSEACVVTLVDLPGITPQEVSTVISAFRRGAEIVAARRDGRQSHPVLVARRCFGELAAAGAGDQGGRSFFRDHAGEVAFVDLPPTVDVDTPEDLARF
jgi:CTP:molybdopterin cytidylyltransferase MocA